MDGIDWLGDSTEEWPEGWGDIAKGVLMPHTAALSLASKVIDRGRPGRKVVSHTQPPPIAQNAREVQGQLTGLLKTVKGVEEKLDETTRQLALLQRASVGVQEADLFRHSLTSAVLGAITAYNAKNPWASWAHLVPLAQNVRGASASIATKPIATLAFPLLAFGVANGGWIKKKIQGRK